MNLHYFSKNHSKFLIKYHIILVVKYRKNLLNKTLKHILSDYFNQKLGDFSVDFIGFDENHLHIMINSVPKLSPLQIVRKIKQETTILIWKKTNLYSEFWKEKTFWTDGYFVCSCGEVSSEIIARYIQNQGGNSAPRLKT